MAEEVNVQLILLVVLAILSLWWVVHTLRQHWSTEPAEPEVARCNFWFRQRETYQFWLVVCVFFSAVLLLSALAADQYGVYNQRTSSPYYQWEKRADVGAFVQKISEMSMGLRPDGNFVDQTITYHISWKQACEAESDGIRRGKCETARAGSIVMFTMLLAALLLLVAALGLMARTNVTFHRAQARIREAVANGQRRLGLQPDGPGWANLPPPELPVLLCQLVTPAVARCIGLVFWLLLFAGLTHALIVYTSFYGWSSNYDSKNTYFKASWFLVEVLVIPLFLAKMFVDAQLRYGARPDYSKLQSFPSAIRGDGLEAELLDPDTGLPLPLPLPLPVGEQWRIWRASGTGKGMEWWRWRKLCRTSRRSSTHSSRGSSRRSRSSRHHLPSSLSRTTRRAQLKDNRATRIWWSPRPRNQWILSQKQPLLHPLTDTLSRRQSPRCPCPLRERQTRGSRPVRQ